MIISKKKYEKLNNDLVEAKAKVDDAKKALDDENKIMKVNLLIKEQRDDYKAQRDTLIDDIAILRANNERLEREHEKLKSVKEDLTNRVRKLDLHLQIQHDELMSSDEEVRYWKDKYTALTNHIRDMRSDMLKTYENYEVQKHVNKDEGIHKILEGAQISLAVVLDELSKIDELKRADDDH